MILNNKQFGLSPKGGVAFVSFTLEWPLNAEISQVIGVSLLFMVGLPDNT